MTYQTWLYEKNYVIDEIKRYAEVILLILENLLMFVSTSIFAQNIVEVGDLSRNCLLDPNCINRLHPAILMTARANPGDSIIFYSRNCDDIDLAPTAPSDPRRDDKEWGAVHPLAGPVYIEGANPGDVLKMNMENIIPGEADRSIQSQIL